MTTSNEDDAFGRHPTLWKVTAVKWVLENRDYRYRILLGSPIKNPAEEIDITSELETIEAPDLQSAVAAAHALLDRHAREAGDLGVEIYLISPILPSPEREALGVRHYTLTAEAYKQARAARMRGPNLEVRVARMVRHAAPFDHKIANLRFRGIIMRVEDDVVTWIGLAVPPRRRKRSTRRKSQIHGIANDLYMVAKLWANSPESEIRTLGSICKKVQPRSDGLPESARRSLAPFRTSATFRRFCCFRSGLWPTSSRRRSPIPPMLTASLERSGSKSRSERLCGSRICWEPTSRRISSGRTTARMLRSHSTTRPLK